MSDSARYTEAAWQTVNVVDTGQTITIAREPATWHERDPIGKIAFTTHPSEGRVYAVMAGFAITHYAVTRWLDEEDPGRGPWHIASKAWQGITLAWKVGDVANNAALGIGLWRQPALRGPVRPEIQ
jgi:hypothetical protein